MPVAAHGFSLWRRLQYNFHGSKQVGEFIAHTQWSKCLKLHVLIPCILPLFILMILQTDVPLTPCLMVTGSAHLYVDRHLMFQASCTFAAVACLFVAFWVFKIEYPKKAHKLLFFIKHAFLGLSQTKPQIKALELINSCFLNAAGPSFPRLFQLNILQFQRLGVLVFCLPLQGN